MQIWAEREKYITIKEVCERLKLSRRTIYRHLAYGELKATKLGQWRVKVKDLEAFMDDNANK